MNLNDFRKKIFLNSQYCTYYIDKGCTVLAGIMRSCGYKYAVKLPEDKISQINYIYRKFTTLMNCLVFAEILLYVYLFVFPYYLKLLKMPFLVMGLTLSAIPLVMLFLTYVTVNCFYEKHLISQVGTFHKVKFEPNMYNIETSAYETYRNTPKKSVYVLIPLVFVFLYYACMPLLIVSAVSGGKYEMAMKSANLYSKFFPIFPDVYAQRAYSKFKLGKYQDAVKDYELANVYSNSTVFDADIIGVKIYYLPFGEMIKLFDATIDKQDKKIEKQFFMSEKAKYLMKNNKYNQALPIFNELIKAYRNREDTAFAPEEVYWCRSKARLLAGDIQGATVDKAIANKMCPECTFDFETKLVNQP